MLPKPFTLNLIELWKMIHSFVREISILVTTKGMPLHSFLKPSLRKRFQSEG